MTKNHIKTVWNYSTYTLLDMFGPTSLPSHLPRSTFQPWFGICGITIHDKKWRSQPCLRFAAEVNGLDTDMLARRLQFTPGLPLSLCVNVVSLCVLLFSARRGLPLGRYIVHGACDNVWKHHTTNCRRLKIYEKSTYSSMLYLLREESHMSLHVVLFPIPLLPSPCWSEDKAKMSTTSCTDVIPPSTNMSKPAAALPKKETTYMIVHGKGGRKQLLAVELHQEGMTSRYMYIKLVRDGWKNKNDYQTNAYTCEINILTMYRTQHITFVQLSTSVQYALNDHWTYLKVKVIQRPSTSMVCLLGVPPLPRPPGPPVRLSLQRSRLRPSTSPAIFEKGRFTATAQCSLNTLVSVAAHNYDVLTQKRHVFSRQKWYHPPSSVIISHPLFPSQHQVLYFV